MSETDRPTNRQKKNRYRKKELPEIPPLLRLECREALAACETLWRRYLERPSSFGLPGNQRIQSKLLPKEVVDGLPQSFVQEWQPLEQRYLRACSMANQSTDQPNSFISRSIFEHLFEEYGPDLIYENQIETRYKRSLTVHEQERGILRREVCERAAKLWKVHQVKKRQMASMILDEITKTHKGSRVLPRTVETVAKWIDPVTPDYAKQPGRPKNP